MGEYAPDWSSGSLLSTVRGYVGSGYNQDAPSFAQFCHAASKIIQKRRVRDLTGLKAAPVIFVLGAVPDSPGLMQDVQPMFDRGGCELAGRVWFGAQRLAKGVGIALPKGSDQQVFEYLINDLGVGESPTVFYDAAYEESIIRIYPKGLSEADECQDVSLDSTKITLEYIKLLLDRLHDQLLKTPTSSESARELWKDASKAYPIEESEKGIQKILYSALTGQLAFGPIFVTQEGTSAMGRYDFRLDEQDPVDSSKWTHHAILELKVVKSFTNTGNAIAPSVNKMAVTDGVDQANEYRNDHFCRMAALCCYDMRKAPDFKEAVEHESKRAQQLNVALWSWPIYSTSKKARTENSRLYEK